MNREYNCIYCRDKKIGYTWGIPHPSWKILYYKPEESPYCTFECRCEEVPTLIEEQNKKETRLKLGEYHELRYEYHTAKAGDSILLIRRIQEQPPMYHAEMPDGDRLNIWDKDLFSWDFDPHDNGLTGDFTSEQSGLEVEKWLDYCKVDYSKNISDDQVHFRLRHQGEYLDLDLYDPLRLSIMRLWFTPEAKWINSIDLSQPGWDRQLRALLYIFKERATNISHSGEIDIQDL